MCTRTSKNRHSVKLNDKELLIINRGKREHEEPVFLRKRKLPVRVSRGNALHIFFTRNRYGQWPDGVVFLYAAGPFSKPGMIEHLKDEAVVLRLPVEHTA